MENSMLDILTEKNAPLLIAEVAGIISAADLPDFFHDMAQDVLKPFRGRFGSLTEPSASVTEIHTKAALMEIFHRRQWGASCPAFNAVLDRIENVLQRPYRINASFTSSHL